MTVEGEVFLMEENDLAYLVWSYVSDQVNVVYNKIISIRLEAILTTIDFLEIPHYMARDLVYKINMVSKFLHHGIRLEDEHIKTKFELV